MTVQIRTNTAQVTSVTVGDMGLFVPAAGATTMVFSSEDEMQLASLSADLRVLATDGALGASGDVTINTIVLLDGAGNAVLTADVDTFLSNVRTELANGPYGVYGADDGGDAAVSIPGVEIVRTFVPGVLVNDAVYQTAAGSVDQADASGGFSSMPAIGFVLALNEPVAGQCRIRAAGDMGGFSGLTAQKVMIVGQSPGVIVADDDTGNPDYPDTTTGSGHIMQEVGVVQDATTVILGVNRDYMEF